MLRVSELRAGVFIELDRGGVALARVVGALGGHEGRPSCRRRGAAAAAEPGASNTGVLMSVASASSTSITSVMMR